MVNKFNFTKASLDSISIPNLGERLVFYDTKCNGLQLRVTSTGVKTFSLYRRVKSGSPERITLGRYPDMSIEQSRKNSALHNLKFESGDNPAEDKRLIKKGVSDELTLKQAFDLYVKDYLIPQNKKSVADMQDNFCRYLGTVKPGLRKLRGKERCKPSGAVDWEKKKLSSIKQIDVRGLTNSLNSEVGLHTANRTLELLRAIYNKMIFWKLYKGENPCLGIQKFKMLSRERFLTGDELPRFFGALNQIEHPNFKDFIMISLTTGARKSNVLAMRWVDISSDSNIWTIQSEFSKNGDPLTIPLTTLALQILQRRAKNDSQWVFPASRGDGHMDSPKKIWSELLNAADLKNLRLHDLRRSLGSWAAMSGASLTLIGRALGHKSLEATQVYARLQIDPVRNVMELATAKMLELGGYKNEKNSSQ